MENEEIQDVTEHFTCLKAERCGANTLILRKLDHLVAAADGRSRRFELEYRWHSSSEASLNSVQGNEFIFTGYRDIQGYKKKSLFDLFRLFP
jgi:hypothetical protein